MLSQNVQVLLYQIQYINAEVKNADISLILNSEKKNKNRALKGKQSVLIFNETKYDVNVESFYY